jgi:hypothetical protein
MVSATGFASQGEADSITDARTHHRDQDLSLLLWLPYYYGYGVGVDVRYEFPVLPDGFIPKVNDQFSLEPSLGIAATRYDVTGAVVNVVNFTPALFGDWSFHFSKEFRAYFALGLGFNFATYSGTYPGFSPAYFYWQLALGLFYNFNRDIALRVELGSQGFMIGVAFFFH